VEERGGHVNFTKQVILHNVSSRRKPLGGKGNDESVFQNGGGGGWGGGVVWVLGCGGGVLIRIKKRKELWKTLQKCSQRKKKKEGKTQRE